MSSNALQKVSNNSALSDSSQYRRDKKRKRGLKVKDLELLNNEEEELSPSGPILPEHEINQLINDHHIEAQKIAWKMLNQWRVTLPKDDVVSIVGIALCEAAYRYDPGYNTAFRTFYYYHLRGKLIKEISQIVQDKQTFLTPNLNMDSESEGYLSIFSSRNHSPLVDKNTPEHIVQKRQVRNVCEDAISELDELEQEVIVRYFVFDQPITKIAKELGYCRCHLSRVKNSALKQLQKMFDGASSINEFAGDTSFSSKKRYSGGRGRRRDNQKLGLDALIEKIEALTE